MILIVDNFDSFTFNLVQVFQHLGVDPLVLRNNEEKILDLATDPAFKGFVISPGPSHPKNTGLCKDFLSRVPDDVPVLGVCLGHQLLGWLGGMEIIRAERIMHGKTSLVHHKDQGLFKGLPNPLQACRYHSLLVRIEGDPPFDITAWTDEDEIMGLSYRDKPWMGVQFHPESILTPDGAALLNNFLAMCGAHTTESTQGV